MDERTGSKSWKRLERFASINGAMFYALPPNDDTISLVRQTWRAPASMPFGDETIVPLRGGDDVHWRVEVSPERSTPAAL